jgi:hypothetical protein
VIEKWHLILLSLISQYEWKVLLHAINVERWTPDFASLPKEVVVQIFITPKNPSTLAGLNTHVTTRPRRQTVIAYLDVLY